jgi:hypothetical protein
MKRLCVYGVLLALGAGALACGGNSTLNEDKATVYLVAEVKKYNPDISVQQGAAGVDVSIENLIIHSFTKDPTGTVSSAQDVRLTRWVSTPYRTDGGTTAGPQWVNDIDVYVPAGDQATLENYRVYPAEYLLKPPLLNLFPSHGGVDPETGETHVRETLKVDLYGTTMGGKSISTTFNVAFNFFY